MWQLAAVVHAALMPLFRMKIKHLSCWLRCKWLFLSYKDTALFNLCLWNFHLVSQKQLWRLFFTREKSVFPSPNVGLAPQGRQQRWKLMAKGASRSLSSQTALFVTSQDNLTIKHLPTPFPAARLYSLVLQVLFFPNGRHETESQKLLTFSFHESLILKCFLQDKGSRGEISLLFQHILYYTGLHKAPSKKAKG